MQLFSYYLQVGNCWACEARGAESLQQERMKVKDAASSTIVDSESSRRAKRTSARELPSELSHLEGLSSQARSEAVQFLLFS